MVFFIKTVVKQSILFSVAILVACSSEHSKTASQNDAKQFGAKYAGRSYQQASLVRFPLLTTKVRSSIKVIF